jgi:hypothetical protein
VCDTINRLTGYTSARQGYISQAANTYEYSGYSFTVPAWHQFSFNACVQYHQCRPDAIMISTKSDATALTTASVIAENKAEMSTTPVARSIAGVTPILDHAQTYYIWVKYEAASKTNYISYSYMDYTT